MCVYIYVFVYVYVYGSLYRLTQIRLPNKNLWLHRDEILLLMWEERLTN